MASPPASGPLQSSVSSDLNRRNDERHAQPPPAHRITAGEDDADDEEQAADTELPLTVGPVGGLEGPRA